MAEKKRKSVQYPDLATFSDEDKDELIRAVNNHEDWGGTTFSILLPSGTLDIRKNTRGQWIIW